MINSEEYEIKLRIPEIITDSPNIKVATRNKQTRRLEPCNQIDLGMLSPPNGSGPRLILCQICEDNGILISPKVERSEISGLRRTVPLDPKPYRFSYDDPHAHPSKPKSISKYYSDWYIYIGQCNKCFTIYYGIARG